MNFPKQKFLAVLKNCLRTRDKHTRRVIFSLPTVELTPLCTSSRTGRAVHRVLLTKNDDTKFCSASLDTEHVRHCQTSSLVSKGFTRPAHPELTHLSPSVPPSIPGDQKSKRALHRGHGPSTKQLFRATFPPPSLYFVKDFTAR